ncbi:MAG TPA: trigger factor, partial [Candidatus Paceibacterota bacterium]|nr:trigger factor [Candidatus Paceibacterota bacterium]
MQHTLKYLSQSQIELEISLTPEEMEQFWQTAREKVLSDVHLDGFRKGNIPEELIKNTDLEEKIFDEAASHAFRKSLKEITDELDLELIGTPEVNIKKIAPKEEFIYVVKSAILPKPEVKDYKEISQEVFKGKKNLKVEKKEIQEALEWLQKSRAKIVPVDRPAQLKDVVEVEIKCSEGEKEISDFPKVDRFILGEGRYPGDLET